MIHFRVEESGLRNLERKLQAMEGRLLLVATEIAALSIVMIKSRLQQSLGSKAKHFGVKVEPSDNGGMVIDVGPVDDVGNFIYHGTKPHIIKSPNAMFLGGGVFAHTVLHPGTESMKDEIKEIVSESVRYAAYVVMRTR